MSRTPPNSVKSFLSDEGESRRKRSKKFRKSKFYIQYEEEGEGSSKNAKTIFEYPISSPEYSTDPQNIIFNAQNMFPIHQSTIYL